MARRARSPLLREIASTATNGNLWYYYNIDGSPAWNSALAGVGAGTPAITRFSGGTKIAIVGPQ